eukprot:jgi/Hompol1/100/HPOL_004066-RA
MNTAATTTGTPPPPPGSLPPTRSARAKCWAARDQYFECLDAHKLWLHGFTPDSADPQAIVQLDPTNPPIKSPSDRSLTAEQRATLFTCAKAKQLFDNDCLPSWMLHFSMLRVKELQTKALIEKVQKEEETRHKNPTDFWQRVRQGSSTA